MFIDTHCHLDAAEFDADREDIITAAQAAGVTDFIVPALGRANFAAVLSLAREYPACHAALGVHPLYVAASQAEDLSALRALLQQQRVVALGEIGLDRFVSPRDDALQEWWFVEQLKLARHFDLPVVLHVRHAIDAVLGLLRRHPVVGGIAHAFNGSQQQAEEFIRLGFKLGFGGAMTHPRALRIRRLAASLPLSSLVLETDAPDMAPVWLKTPGAANPRNDPAQLPRMAMTLAQLRGMPLAEIAADTTANARAILRLAA